MTKPSFQQLLQSFSSFLKQLFIARWRPLLALFVGVCLPLLIFEELAVEIWKNEGAFPWDVSILLAIHETTQAQLDAFALFLTQFGGFHGVFLISTVLSLVLLVRRRWRSLAYLLTTLVGTAIINRTAKSLMHRIRPHLWESSYPPAHDYAFPSGHAMSSMALIAVLVILTWGSRWCWFVGIFGSFFVLGIAWTRLYLGVHFPSDILAGWLVSVAWAVGVSLLIKPHLTKANPLSDQTISDSSFSS